VLPWSCGSVWSELLQCSLSFYLAECWLIRRLCDQITTCWLSIMQHWCNSKTYLCIGFLRKLLYPRIRILPIPICVSVSVLHSGDVCGFVWWEVLLLEMYVGDVNPFRSLWNTCSLPNTIDALPLPAKSLTQKFHWLRQRNPFCSFYSGFFCFFTISLLMC